jgi:hypothetical protein
VIQVITPPGGGGGSFAVAPGVYVPWVNKPDCKDKVVLITVKFPENKVWRKSYVVDCRKADILVRVIDVVNAATRRLTVGVNHVKHAARRVTAMFKSNADK